jgi:putative ABC transport system permease protein
MLQDIRYALRTVARNPALAAAAVLTIALGLGANTAIFSVVNAVLLRPLPFRNPDRLVMLWSAMPSRDIRFALADYDMFLGWRERTRSYEEMAAWSDTAGNLTTGGEPEHVSVMRTNANLFRLLGVRPQFGRDFTAEDDRPGAARVVLLDHGLWQRRFGGDRSVAGRQLTVDGAAYTVIGVLPKGLEEAMDTADLYVPMAQAPGPAAMETSVNACARLKPGISVERADKELGALTARMAVERHWVMPLSALVVGMHDFQVRDVRLTVIVLFAAVGLVLLIACANVANLLLARAASRQREVAVRIALGARRGRLIRQFLCESLVLSVCGGVLGLILAYWTVRVLPLVAPESLPFLGQVAIDLRVLGFAAFATLATGLVFGMAPALSASRGLMAEALKNGGRTGERGSRSRFRNSLVVVEVALALMLSCGAALLLRSVLRLQDVHPGFNPDGLLIASIDLPESGYAQPERRVEFYLRLIERLRAMPGIRAAGMSNQLPFNGASSSEGLLIEGAPPPRPSEIPLICRRVVDPGYFHAMQIPLKSGRIFDEHDRTAQAPLALINETMARRYWPQKDPVGRRFGDGRHWTTVIGVVGDVHHMSLATPPDPEFYAPYWQMPVPAMTLVVRTPADPLRAAPAVRAALNELDKEQPVSKLAGYAQQVNHSIASRRLAVILLAVFAAVALALAAVGIYGVVSFSVARRTQEIGIRIALGAPPERVLAEVLLRAGLLALAGVALGTLGALALTRTLRSLLYGVSATDPATFVGVGVLLVAVTLAAAYIPARRAAAVDPIIALRQE